MLRKLVLCLFVVGFSLATFAQSIADIQSPKILPPAPDAAALGKYAQIPVDKSTGVPGISVPIYEIKTPRFSLPISLSYHASGIKVDETSGWVGIGWSLNAGGCVSRSMVGVADESQAGFLNIPIPTAQSLYTNFHNDSSYMENVIKNIYDSQPDNFFYNFAGQSGAFVFSDVTKTPITIPYKPVQITFNNTVSFGTFTILDEQGNTYYFNDTEISHSSASDYLSGATGWYLSKMVSADKSDTVSFSYSPDPNNFTFVDNSYSFTQNVGPGGATGYLWNLVPITNTSRTSTIHISSIVFKGGRVDFVPKTGRKDNGAVSLDAVIISNYDYNAKKYTQLKSFKLLTDYFYSTLSNPQPPYNSNTDVASQYRLKLTGLQENDQVNSTVKTHLFSYNNTMLPPLHNFGQDLWGYYNGNYNNQTLLQHTQFIAPDGSGQNTVYDVPAANLAADRSVSATYMQAGVLTQITYPTKGYTTFSYEPNQYLAPAVTTYQPSANSVGVYQETNSTSFTPTLPGNQTTGQLIFHINISKNPQSSYVQVMQGSTVVYYYPGSTTSNTTLDVPITVTSGTTYQLVAYSHDSIDQNYGSSLPFASIGTSYQVSGSPVPTNVGGLRIKTITNYDNNNAVISAENYKYGAGETGAGEFLTSANLMQYVSSHIYQVAISQGTQIAPETTFSNNSVYNLSSLSGSPVAYDHVTIYHGDPVNNIGKSVYNYSITPDSIFLYQVPRIAVPTITDFNSQTNSYTYWVNPGISSGSLNGMKPIPRLWQNGEPVSELHYQNSGNGQYTLAQSKNTVYNTIYRTAGRGLYIQLSLEFGPGTQRNTFNHYTTPNDFIFYDYPISNGARIPVQTISNDYAAGKTDTVNYFYDNRSHLYPTRIFNYDGKGNTLLKQVLYPQDMVNAGQDPTGIYAAMVSANIISPVIQVTESKNTTQLEQSITNYSKTTPRNVIKPSSVSLQVLANPAEIRLNYNKYDSLGNVLTVSKPYGIPVSYQWGYNGAYPVAEVKNAPANNFFYEGFEDGNGNSGNAKTGHYSYAGAYSKILTGLTGGAYTLTYWQNTGTAWALTTTPVTVNGSSYTINAGGTGTVIDDIRFYPAGAMMTTYTYDPLVGVTSTTDEKGKIMYYEYDGLQRLMNIRDQYKNIVKSFCYNYIGQTTNCYIDLPTFKNVLSQGVFNKKCDIGYDGSPVTYKVLAGTYVSNISQQDADSQAQSDIAANGQNYANANGTCVQKVNFYINNSVAASGMQVTFYGQTTANYSTTVNVTGQTTIGLPPDTYNIVISSGGVPYNYALSNGAQSGGTQGGFSGVVILPGSTPLTLTINH